MTSTLAIIMIAVIVVLFLTSLKKGAAKGAEFRLRKRVLLTHREQAMYNRLRDTLPWLHVFPQVSFGALLDTPMRKHRNYFDRKIADFVLCDASLTPIACIELDDASHKNHAARDTKRDKMLADAGYRVVRYSNVPDSEKLRTDFPQPVPRSS